MLVKKTYRKWDLLQGVTSVTRGVARVASSFTVPFSLSSSSSTCPLLSKFSHTLQSSMQKLSSCYFSLLGNYYRLYFCLSPDSPCKAPCFCNFLPFLSNVWFSICFLLLIFSALLFSSIYSLHHHSYLFVYVFQKLAGGRFLTLGRWVI